MHIATHHGHVEVARMLVEAGADVEALAADGATPMHIAAQNAHLEVVRTLVEAGADVEAQKARGSRPMHIAAAHGQVDAMRTLRELGADIEAMDAAGRRPVYYAAHYKQTEAVRLLAELAGDPTPASRVTAAWAAPVVLLVLLLLYGVRTFMRYRDKQSRRSARMRRENARLTAALLEEEERANAQTKVRVAPPSPHIGLHSVQLGGE